MSINDSVSDMLSRIRNAQMAGLQITKTPSSKLRKGVLSVLKNEGYIEDYTEEKAGNFNEINITLKYHEGRPAIKTVKRISKPGRRQYSNIQNLPKHYNGLGIYILSTPKGVMSDYEARLNNVGGEVLCSVF